MTLNILPSVVLELRTTPRGDDECCSFEVIGPARKLGLLHSAPSGMLSPRSAVTLDGAAKEAAGIPAKAASFSFAYPVSINLDHVDLNAEPWAFFLILGGFIYFEESGTMIQANALTLLPSIFHLTMVGPFQPTQEAVRAMVQQGRMASTTMDHFQDAGLATFGWIHPREEPGGHSLSAVVEHTHGAFLYGMESEGSGVFYLLTPDPDDARAGDAETSAEASRSAHRGVQNAMSSLQERVHRFSSMPVASLRSLRSRVSKVNKTGAHLAANSVRLLRSELQKSHVAVRMRCLWCLVCVASYLLLGASAFAYTEEWSYLDGIYFAVVTMSTVGYGDLAPVTTTGRVINIAFIAFGVFVIYGQVPSCQEGATVYDSAVVCS